MVLLAMLFAACTPDRVAPPQRRIDAVRTAPAVHSPTGPETRTAVPSFRRDILPVLERHCASARDCHGDEPTDSVALDLRAAAAYRELVNRRSAVRPSAMLVAPGDPAASFLVDKLTGTLAPREGKPMPLDPQTGAPMDPGPVSGEFVRGPLSDWIRAGAPEN